jgi:hypothetical protein
MLRHVSSQTLRALGFHETFKQLTLINGNRHLFADSKIVKCWKCGAQKSVTLFCDKCNVLQEPDTKSTYFDVMGVDKRFNIKATELTSKFRKLQSVLHPDKFGSKDKV